jgi:hypothetical protein
MRPLVNTNKSRNNNESSNDTTAPTKAASPHAEMLYQQRAARRRLGITAFAGDARQHRPTLRGVERRATPSDFVVHEVDVDGRVVQLPFDFDNADSTNTSTSAAATTAASLSSSSSSSSSYDVAAVDALPRADVVAAARGVTFDYQSVALVTTQIDALLNAPVGDALYEEDDDTAAASTTTNGGVSVGASIASFVRDNARDASTAEAVAPSTSDAEAPPTPTLVIDAAIPRSLREPIRLLLRSHLPHVSTSVVSVDGKQRLRLQLVSAGVGDSGNGSGNRSAGSAASKRASKSGDALRWHTAGGDYLQFTLYKDNTATAAARATRAHGVGVNTARCTVAGSKDQFAQTTQRVTAYQVTATALRTFARSLLPPPSPSPSPSSSSSTSSSSSSLSVSAPAPQPRLRVGAFAYTAAQLSLGRLRGNLFRMRVRAPARRNAGDVVASAVAALNTRGFVNYFGEQRFSGEAAPLFGAPPPPPPLPLPTSATAPHVPPASLPYLFAASILAATQPLRRPRWRSADGVTVPAGAGSGSGAASHVIGRLLLQGDWRGAALEMLRPRGGQGEIGCEQMMNAHTLCKSTHTHTLTSPSRIIIIPAPPVRAALHVYRRQRDAAAAAARMPPSARVPAALLRAIAKMDAVERRERLAARR